MITATVGLGTSLPSQLAAASAWACAIASRTASRNWTRLGRPVRLSQYASLRIWACFSPTLTRICSKAWARWPSSSTRRRPRTGVA